MATSFDYSIIIPTFNTRELTLSCIRFLKAHPSAKTYEIIVVDNASQDGTREAVARAFPDIQVIANTHNLGFSKACNQGAKSAKGAHICFLNSDTEASGPELDQLSQWLLEHSQTGIVAPELRATENRIIQMSWGWNPILAGEFIQQYFAPYAILRSGFKQKLVAWLQRHPRHVSIVCGACLMIRRDIFEQLQGFDEDFELYFEDSDLCVRCNDIGKKVDFLPQVKVVHHLGKSSVRRSWGIVPLIYRQSQIHYYRKHAPAFGVPLLKVYLFCKWSLIFFKYFLNTSQQELIAVYLHRFMDVILERKHFTLDLHKNAS